MKARLIAITAAGLCLAAGAAQAQMPADAQELVQTMRPMQIARTAPAPQDDSKQAASTDDTSYGGAPHPARPWPEAADIGRVHATPRRTATSSSVSNSLNKPDIRRPADRGTSPIPSIPHRPFARISRAEIRAPARVSRPPKPYFGPAKKLRWSDIETARTAPIWVSQRPQRARRFVPSG